MIENHYLNALRKICLRLNACQSNWVVTGSLGMALHGMSIDIHDIDIQTDQHGAYEIEDLLFEYVVKPVHYLASEQICSHLGIMELDGVKVEIMGAVQKLLAGQVWEEPVKVEQHRQWISFEGIQVPVLSLEYEHEAYLKLGRIKKADKIRKWLKNNRPQNEKVG